MKKGILILVSFLSTLSLLAQEPFFCTRPGTKLYYERYKAGTTKLTQTTLFEIESIKQTAKGQEVHYAVTMAKANGNDLYGGRAIQTTLIAPNGDVNMNFGETVKGFVRNMFSHAKVEVSEAWALLPAKMQPGDTLPETHCTVTVAGLKAYFHITDRRVLRKETITTPAGTFDCIVVRERKEEDAPFHHPDNWLDNYYAPGYGYVRHDKYDKNMRLQESEVLVRIEDSQASASDSQP